MTRKDYVATANILKDYLDELGIETMSDLVTDFSDYFQSDNPNFNADKFYQAVMDN